MSVRQPLSMRAISLNLRFLQSEPYTNEEPWPVRLPLILKQLRFLTAQDSATSTTFMCMQEVSQGQLEDIISGLNGIEPFRQVEPRNHGGKRVAQDGSGCRIEHDEQAEETPDAELITSYKTGEWSYIGVGREDGALRGEYVPVLYRVSDWKCTSWRTSWVSETPSKPSRDWDAACTRHITTGTFTHRNSGFQCAVTAVHLDHIGAVAQQKGAEQALADMKRAFEAGIPAIMAGDFNVPPTSSAYKVLEEDESVVDARLEAKKLGDAATWNEDVHTYTSFGGEYPSDLIDFIFVSHGPTSRNGTLRVKGYAVMPSRLEDGGVLLSDHRAVVADLILEDGN